MTLKFSRKKRSKLSSSSGSSLSSSLLCHFVLKLFMLHTARVFDFVLYQEHSRRLEKINVALCIVLRKC